MRKHVFLQENIAKSSKKNVKTVFIATTNNYLRIASLNINRGLFDKEEVLINTIEELNFDICAVSEVDIKDFDEKKPFSIDGFKTYFPLQRPGTNTKTTPMFCKIQHRSYQER